MLITIVEEKQRLTTVETTEINKRYHRFLPINGFGELVFSFREEVEEVFGRRGCLSKEKILFPLYRIISFQLMGSWNFRFGNSGRGIRRENGREI